MSAQLPPTCTGEVRIIREDPDFLLVEKPAFLLSIPGRHRTGGDCLLYRLLARYPTAKTCHRLDLDTSGIMIVALHPAALAVINRQFEQRAVRKVYEALVYGIVQPDSGTIELPIAPDWENRPLSKICRDRGKPALTRFEVMARDQAGGQTRVRLFPLTGRSHQLRLHLKEIGHPIIGCDLYAHPGALAMSPRLLLHASHIAFTHPRTGLPVEGFSQPPF